ncbi:hypothetical protein AA14337_2711 [Acetobacter malorum DSM 14337]|uniref:Uncharacterized protein n=1 Tax=Acetobacter malorum DSM 14337 TaxID=1307910 RepID=A0ABQ0PXC5_9PROT|nr:hypothetical protein [Acetobacter malorum]GBQ83912.1 hypothetical protein AA14337_2711 [Acetobacter malorum DSM 14337]
MVVMRKPFSLSNFKIGKNGGLVRVFNFEAVSKRVDLAEKKPDDHGSASKNKHTNAPSYF